MPHPSPESPPPAPDSPPGPSRRSAVLRPAFLVPAGLIASFWVLVVVAASRNPDYDPVVDVISSTASRGSQVPALGILALLLSAASHFVVASGLARERLNAVVGGLAVAGAGLVFVAAFRVHCPDRPYCSSVEPDDWRDVVHVGGVVVYAVAMLVVMLLVARAARRTGWDRLAVASVLTAIAFTAAFIAIQGSSPGLAQRIWVAIGQAFLLTLPLVRDRLVLGRFRPDEGVHLS